MILSGCKQNYNEYELGSLRFKLPEGYIETSRVEDQIDSHIPDQAPTIEYFISFQNALDEKIYLFYWQGFPWRGYGPMSIKETYTVKIGNHEFKIIRTNMFMGDEKEVLVTHAELPNNDRFMIYSPDIRLAEFKKFLNVLNWK